MILLVRTGSATSGTVLVNSTSSGYPLSGGRGPKNPRRSHSGRDGEADGEGRDGAAAGRGGAGAGAGGGGGPGERGGGEADGGRRARGGQLHGQAGRQCAARSHAAFLGLSSLLLVLLLLPVLLLLFVSLFASLVFLLLLASFPFFSSLLSLLCPVSVRCRPAIARLVGNNAYRGRAGRLCFALIRG